jgi:predicted aspartyl protease
MRTPFHPQQGLILITARIWGPAGDTYARLALDTGATSTTINVAKLVYAGYDPAIAPDRVQMTTGSGIEFVPRLLIDRIVALGQERTNLRILAHTLPTSASVDGLLGLDFFRGQHLSIDFRNGEITLT